MSSVTPLAPTVRTQQPLAVEAPADTPVAVALASMAQAADAALAEVVPPSPVAKAVATAKAQAAGAQDSAAPLFANLEQALASPGLPRELRAAIRSVLALQIPTDRPITTETLKAAVARSGLFLEAHLAAADPREARPLDLKAALLTLRDALAAAGALPGPQALKPRIASPPVRDGAVVGQPPAEPTLSAEAEPKVIVEALRGQTEQAIARQTLHQLASLPDGRNPVGWMFELPFATPQGAALAQFAVEPDEHGAASGAEASGGGWRARFSIATAPLGPVHVHLRMISGIASATVWAEHQETFLALRSQGADLAGALGGEVVFHPGAPHPPTLPPGRLVDQTS